MPARTRRSASRSTSAVVICGRPCLNAALSRPPSPCVELRRMGGFPFDGRCEPPPHTSPTIPERRCCDRSRAGTAGEDERTGCSLERHAPCLLRGCAQRGGWGRAGGQGSFSPDKTLSVSKRRLRSDGPLCAIIPPVHVASLPEKVAQFAVLAQSSAGTGEMQPPFACAPRHRRLTARCFLSTCDSDKRRRLIAVYNRKVRTCSVG